jgi:hypothetical protein
LLSVHHKLTTFHFQGGGHGKKPAQVDLREAPEEEKVSLLSDVEESGIDPNINNDVINQKNNAKESRLELSKITSLSDRSSIALLDLEEEKN